MLAPFLIDIEKELLPVACWKFSTDRTTGNNIFWATSDEEHLGKAPFGDTITLKQVTGKQDVVIPQSKVKRGEETCTKTGEIFTPGFVTNNAMHLMNHLQA